MFANFIVKINLVKIDLKSLTFSGIGTSARGSSFPLAKTIGSTPFFDGSSGQV
jgi:hypothetical protein